MQHICAPGAVIQKVYQRVAVVNTAAASQGLHAALVACQLRVTARQICGQPDEGVEPVNAQQQAAQQAAEEAAKAEADKKAEAEAEAEKAQQEADQAAADKEAADQKAEEAQDKAEQSQGSSTGTGSLTWPLPGYTSISSPFGSRICPFHGVEYHNGVDIPAPGGTAIHAADSGVVVAAQYHSSLGNYIIINHGNGIQTYYLHTSAMYVSVGTKVSKGDVIAAVGTTGSSTGNHLDFRVNVNGSYVNPLSYASPY